MAYLTLQSPTKLGGTKEVTVCFFLTISSSSFTHTGASKLNGKTSGTDSSYRDKKQVYDNMGPEMHNYRVIQPFSNVSAIRHSQQCCTVTTNTSVTPGGTLWSHIRGNVESDLLLPEYRTPLAIALSAAQDQKCPL
jgi:hypothetical protein